MKKLYLLLIIVLLITCCCTLFACNKKTNVEPQVIVVDPVTQDTAVNTVSSAYAWEKVKNAALNTNTSTAGFLNFNTILGFDFKKNGNGNKFVLQVAGSINQEDTPNSRIYIGLDKITVDNVQSRVAALYYVDGWCYADFTGVKKGAEIVKTDKIDLAYFADRIHNMFAGTSIADIFYTLALIFFDFFCKLFIRDFFCKN